MRPSLLLLLIVGALAGCGGGSGVPVIRNATEYSAVSKQAFELTRGPFIKLDNGEEMTEVDKRDLRQAAKLLDGMKAFSPDNFSLNMQAGTIHLALDENEDAVKEFLVFETVIPKTLTSELKPLVTLGFFQFSVALFRTQQYADAEKAVNRALKDDPNSAKMLTHRASIRVQNGNTKGAKEDAMKALKLDPNQSRAAGILRLLDEV